jgi:hypothetical protein
MRKALTLILIAVLALSSLVMVETAFAQSVPRPSVPEFTVKYVDHSYVVPASTFIDPYTGKQISYPSYKVENKTVDVIIENQPYTPTNLDGNVTGLFYIIRWKGHFENWTGYYDGNDYFNINHLGDASRIWGISASNSANTVQSFTDFSGLSKDAEVDFQVRAVIGFNFLYFGGHIQPIGTVFHYVQESDWSNTQTVTIGELQTTSPEPTSTPEPTIPTSPTPSPELTPTPYSEPQLTEQELILGIAITIAIVGAGLGLLVYLIKRK